MTRTRYRFGDNRQPRGPDIMTARFPMWFSTERRFPSPQRAKLFRLFRE